MNIFIVFFDSLQDNLSEDGHELNIISFQSQFLGLKKWNTALLIRNGPLLDKYYINRVSSRQVYIC